MILGNPLSVLKCCPKTYPGGLENVDVKLYGYDWHLHEFRFTCNQKNLIYIYPEGIKAENVKPEDKYKYITGETCHYTYLPMRKPLHDIWEIPGEVEKERKWAYETAGKECYQCKGEKSLI